MSMGGHIKFQYILLETNKLAKLTHETKYLHIYWRTIPPICDADIQGVRIRCHFGDNQNGNRYCVRLNIMNHTLGCHFLFC